MPLEHCGSLKNKNEPYEAYYEFKIRYKVNNTPIIKFPPPNTIESCKGILCFLWQYIALIPIKNFAAAKKGTNIK